MKSMKRRFDKVLKDQASLQYFGDKVYDTSLDSKQ